MLWSSSGVRALQHTRGSSPPRPPSATALHPRPTSEQSPIQRNLSAGSVAGSGFTSIIGFLFSFSLASTYAAYHLLDEYKAASAALQTSVEELQASTAKVTAHVRRIEAVEKDLRALSQNSASKGDLSRVRAEVKKLHDGLHIEFLDLRNLVWGMQQDLHALAKKEATTVHE